MAKYSSPFSVGRRQTVPVDLLDSRNINLEKYRSNLGSDIKLIQTGYSVAVEEEYIYCIYDTLFIELFDSINISAIDEVPAQIGLIEDDIADVVSDILQIQTLFEISVSDTITTENYSADEVFAILVQDLDIISVGDTENNIANPTDDIQDAYRIFYDGNGQTAGDPPVAQRSYFTGDLATVLSSGTLQKFGYVFAGWNTQANGSGITYQPGNTITITNSDINLYAVWNLI